jgi:hypothetical protein
MNNEEKNLRDWLSHPPVDARCEDVKRVMEHLGMVVRGDNHLIGFHPNLVGSPFYPQGTICIGCHAFGKQGIAHPRGVKDLLRAARLLQGEDGDT